MKDRIREIIKIDLDEYHFDMTAKASLKIDGEIYEYIEDHLSSADGEGHTVIWQRKSDGTYFKYNWFLSWSQRYHFSDEMIEVFARMETVYRFE